MWEINAGRKRGDAYVLRILGPEDANLRDLANEFSHAYGISLRPASKAPGDLCDAVVHAREGEDRARLDGFSGETATELFVDWLIRCKGFTRGADDDLVGTPARK